MQYTGMTEMFSFVGEMFNKGFAGPAKKFGHAVHHRGDNIVNFWTTNNRPIKLIGFMAGSFAIVSGGAIINRKIKTSQLIASTTQPPTHYTDSEAIYPRLQQSLNHAFRYAQNGNITLLDKQLDDIAGIIIQYPEFKKYVKYKQPIIFNTDQYINGAELKSPHQTTMDSIQKENKTDETEQNMNNDESAESETILLKSQSADMASMVLSMNEKELKKELLQNNDTENDEDVIKFENELDYIRHIGVIKRCEKIYFRAIRHAKKGNVEECAKILSELWEFVNGSGHSLPIIIDESDGKKRKLEEKDLSNVMKMSHRNYVLYLIETTKNVGNKIDQKNVNKQMKTEMNRTVLNMVWKNLENAKNYANKYNVFSNDIKQEIHDVWSKKENEYKVSYKQKSVITV